MYDITIDPSRDDLIGEAGIRRLRESYMMPQEKTGQERFAYAVSSFATDQNHAQRLYEYTSKHWLSLSTPLLSHGRNKKGLGISCFLNHIPDTASGLVENLSETNWLSMLGGGVGIHMGIRSVSEKSTGVMAHSKTYDASSSAYRQGSTRRGSYAIYLDISHPEIIQFIEMRKATGDQNIRCLNLHHAINIPDSFMQIIEECMKDRNYDDSWDLVDPHTGNTVKTVSAKDLWQRILDTRLQTGEPYIHFIDRSNDALPDFLKERGLRIRQSNLCSEVILPTDKDRTAVCCLSSVNLEYFDDWKNESQFIPDIMEMLDNVLTLFISNAPDAISRAVYSASRERSVGLGALGFHAYLQKNGIPFESAMAKSINIRLFSHIKSQVDKANIDLGRLRGEAPDASGTGRRFCLTMAIAPNASSSLIMGNTSPSIEPFRANVYRQDTLSGATFNYNKYLKAIIKSRFPGKEDEIWSLIIANEGSIQGMEQFSQDEQDIFKTAIEIDQRWIIEHAATRQHYIDQSQSLNLFFRPQTTTAYLHLIHYLAWKRGLKTLYYLRSEKVGKSDKLAEEIEREIISEIDLSSISDPNACLACEG